MTQQDFIGYVLGGYKDMISAGLPVAMFIAVVNVSFNIIITAFTGGGFRFGRRGE